MNEFFKDLKGAFKEFKFTSPDIDSNTGTQKFLRAARPIVLASAFVMVLGIMNSQNDEYLQEKAKKKNKFDEDIMQEWYSNIRNNVRPLFLRYLDLVVDHSQNNNSSNDAQNIPNTTTTTSTNQ